MKQVSWTYELPSTGAGSEGLEEYEARCSDGEHVGVVVGLVRRAEMMFVIVDAGAMTPFIRRRLAVRWEDVADVDHAALVIQLSFDRAGLDEAALVLDPKKTVHGRGAEAVRAQLPAALRGEVHRWLGGKGELVLFAVGGGLLYLTTLLAITLTWGKDLPLLAWIGFAIASAVVLAASTILAFFLVRSSTGAGSEPPQRRPRRTTGVHRVLVVADEGCSGAALCRPLAERLEGRRTEVLVVAPALLSATHYLDSDVDAGREAAERRLAETVAAFDAAGISARGEVGSESPLEATSDALTLFAADEIVVATPPPERANWLEEGVVERARALYEQPVSHLVVEGAAPLELRRH